MSDPVKERVIAFRRRRRRSFAVAIAVASSVLCAAAAGVAVTSCAIVTGLDGYDLVNGDCTNCDAAVPVVGLDAATTDEKPTSFDGAAIDAPNDVQVDATVDAATPPCNLGKPFGAPVMLSSLSGVGREGGIRFSPDERTAYFGADRNTTTYHDLYVATRPTIGDTFTTPVRLDNLVTTQDEKDPMITADGLSLFFSRGADILLSKRTTTGVSFKNTTTIVGANTGDFESTPFLFELTSTLFFASDQSGSAAIYRAAFDGAGVSNVTLEDSVTSGSGEVCPVLRADGRVIYFTSNRAGGSGKQDIWTASRATSSGAFGPATPVTEINSDKEEYANWTSADGCRLYFSSNRSGDFHAYVATRP